MLDPFTKDQLINLRMYEDYTDIWYDLSDYETYVDWSKIEAINVIVKIGGSLGESKLGVTHCRNAYAAGKRIFLYYWNDPIYDPIKQADHFLTLAQQLINEGIPVYGLFVDVEQWWSDWSLWRKHKGDQKNKLIPNATDQQISDNGEQMVNRLKSRTSITVVVYTGNWFVESYSPSMKKWLVKNYLWVSYYWYSGDRKEVTWQQLKQTYQPGADRVPIRWEWMPLDKLVLWQWSGDVFMAPGMWSIKGVRKKPGDYSCYRGRVPAKQLFHFPDDPTLPIPTNEDPEDIITVEPLIKLIDNVKVLDVPYIPQMGQGADMYRNDCGAGCGVMIIKAYKKVELTVDQFYKKTGVIYDKYLFISQIRDVIKSFGINTNYESGVKPGRLYEVVSSNVPVIALIQYAPLVDAGLTQNKVFRDAHFVVVVGFNADTVYIHDPLHDDGKGSFLAVPIKVFDKAWSTTDDANSNPERAIVFPVYPIGAPAAVDPNIKSGIVKTSLNVRKIPGVITQANWLRGLKEGDKVSIETTKTVNGDPWGKLANEDAWIALNFVTML